MWLDGDDAVSPPALLCCAAVKESSSACAGDGVARAGDGGGVPSLERRRGDPSVEDGVTDRARRAAAACWSGSAALKDWVESSMARPGFTSERRAQSVRVVLFNERDSGVSAPRAFLPSLSEPGDASTAGPATAGRVNSYCRPALAPGNRWLARRRGDSRCNRGFCGAELSPWLAPGSVSRGGAPPAAIHERSSSSSLPTKMAEKRTCTRHEAADDSSDRPRVFTGHGRTGFPIVRVDTLCWPQAGNASSQLRFGRLSALPGRQLEQCVIGGIAFDKMQRLALILPAVAALQPLNGIGVKPLGGAASIDVGNLLDKKQPWSSAPMLRTLTPSSTASGCGTTPQS